MARGSDQDISEIKQRLALIESRLEQVFERLDMARRLARLLAANPPITS